ncbi:TIGR02678 family protein [Carnobacterium sp. ISL-102]|uniref:TIGR02678 family protein n=1 Tax=Carnobacterium sp. ISL-102 TaxID=2819142 RepID=UPI001BEC58C1|nr:TIGR02678 family protein [Carnobacterium sp. ISL-102]MBT2732255.1 TIGR02678 family protein [Carnobacterium sp. ISL-102]
MENERIRECINVLMENKWIIKGKDPQLYRMIREEQKIIRKFCNEKLGANLYIHGQFIMLEKIPDHYASWMGIDTFREQDDYTMYSLILVYLEEKMSSEQFLLTNICEELGYIWTDQETVDWSTFKTRMNFVRAMTYCVEQQLIHQVDGDTTNFKYHQEADVLYEVTQMSRYVLRSYPEDYQQFNSFIEFKQYHKQALNLEDTEIRRQKVYRNLLYSPAVLRRQYGEEFAYIRNYRNSIQDDLEKYTYFQLEVYKNLASATNREDRGKLTLFPDNKNSSSLILQWFVLLREEIEKEKLLPNEYGEIQLSRMHCETLLEQTKERFQLGWSKMLIEKTISSLLSILLNEMVIWDFCSIEDEVMIRFYPSSGRLIGEYTQETKDKIKESL